MVWKITDEIFGTMAGEVRLTINGINMQAPQDQSLLLTIRQQGIDIPTLCHHPDLNRRKASAASAWWKSASIPSTRIVNSCTYPTEGGLMVQTHSEQVLQARRMVLELLLARCPKAELIQELAADHGVYESRFKTDDPEELCILCGLCVRTCRDVVGVSAISMAFRISGQTGDHALPGKIRRLHRLRFLRLHLPHQRHSLHRERWRPHHLGPGLRTPALRKLRQLHRPQGPTGTLGQTHRRPGGEFLYL